MLPCEGFIKKNHGDTLRAFLSLLKKDRVYSFVLVAFFVDISTSPSFKDDRSSIIL